MNRYSLMSLLHPWTGACCLALLAACSDTQSESRSAAPSQAAGIVANQFEVSQLLSGETLTLSIETDLPDETELMVSVARGYRRPGDTTAYSHAYFAESSIVGEWRVPRRVLLDEQEWRNGLVEKQRLLARTGSPFSVGEVDDSVEISFIVPVNQDDPRFGSRNEHLTGRAVKPSSFGWPIIRREVSLARPTVNAGTNAPTWASASDLQVGNRYRISRGTPLMPEIEPADPMAAIALIQQIPSGGAIQIHELRNRGGTPWYRATAYGAAGESIGDGWINSTALIGQDLQVVR
jgi:hypothetical protein